MEYSGVVSTQVDAPDWRKSSRSSDPAIAACVEVARTGNGRRGIRDSKKIDDYGNNTSPVIEMDTSTFGRFLSAVKAL